MRLNDNEGARIVVVCVLRSPGDVIRFALHAFVPVLVSFVDMRTIHRVRKQDSISMIGRARYDASKRAIARSIAPVLGSI